MRLFVYDVSKLALIELIIWELSLFRDELDEDDDDDEDEEEEDDDDDDADEGPLNVAWAAAAAAAAAACWPAPLPVPARLFESIIGWTMRRLAFMNLVLIIWD